jgi:Right handed beta helix region
MTSPTFISSLTMAAAVGALTCQAFGAGETITVTTCLDAVDFGGAQTVAELPGPGGKVSMREAVLAANNTPGPQTIAFAMPLAELWLLTDVFLLQNEGSAWFVTDDFTTIDFTTQELTTDVNPDGNEVGVYGLHPSFLGQAALTIAADHCVVKGMHRVLQRGYGVDISGNHNRVIASTIDGPLYAGVRITGGFGGPSSTGNIIGGMAPGEGNRLSSGNAGVRIDGPAHENIVIGNVLTGSFAGIEVRSATCCPGLEAIDNRIGGPTPAERNVINGAGHYGEEGFPVGTQVSIEYATGTVVEGNYIGTNAAGTAAPTPQRGPTGVGVLNAPGTIVSNNLISGLKVMGINHYAGQLFGIAVAIQGGSAGTRVHGNTIGVQADGVTPLATLNGVYVATFPGTPAPSDIIIGGSAPGEGNLIAHTERRGVFINWNVNGMEIAGNSIHSNGELGIDLTIFGSSGFGVTPNDLGDGDDGGNRLQNFPVLTAAMKSGSTMTVDGTFNSVASQSYRLEFFGNAACDPTGHGEGQAFLGSAVVATNGAGNASFSAVVPAGGSPGFVTATATRLGTRDTSEFSACVTVVVEADPADLNGDGVVNGFDLAILLAAGAEHHRALVA